jgi:Predicted regulator of amino acid metabolism, contains ACT domain
MDRILSKFSGFPSQENVAMIMLRYGVRVDGGKAYCGDIELSDSAIGRAAKVDRRVVRSTIDKICSTPALYAIFSKLRSISLFSDAAPEMGCTTIEIVPVDATIPGILADVTEVIFRAGISVRQAVVDDPGIRKEAHLIVVLNGQLPPEYIPMLRAARGVSQIIIR